jgi:subtilisin family serine protease
MEFDELVRDADALALGDQPYILEFSAGNAGPGTQTIGSPAVAKNVIATGASENDRPDFLIYSDGPDAMADFSSRGPCEDGRIKPDVVTPGTWIASLQSASASDQYAWAPIDDFYQYQGGTSQAGPHASGAAAVFVQYYRLSHANATPSPALVKAALINSATDMDDSFGTSPVPNMDEGWGRVDLTPFVASARTFDFVDQTELLTNSQVFEHQVVIASSAEPLKITLAYTDVPGFPGALAALVNDLDLEVVAPDGRLYRGNQFDGGESIPNASGADSINNVEAVHLATPLPGE